MWTALIVGSGLLNPSLAYFGCHVRIVSYTELSGLAWCTSSGVLPPMALLWWGRGLWEEARRGGESRRIQSMSRACTRDPTACRAVRIQACSPESPYHHRWVGSCRQVELHARLATDAQGGILFHLPAVNSLVARPPSSASHRRYGDLRAVQASSAPLVV